MSLFSPGQKYTPPPTPYGGLVMHDKRLQPAQTAPHLLVSGPSGVGKSRRVLGPGILLWAGPVVAVSSKPDLVDLCLEARHERPGAPGRTFILDLSGEVPGNVLPDGVRKVVLDPVALVTCDDDAIDVATILMQSGAAGAGGGNGKGGGDAFWESISTAPLAAILRAAGGDGIAWAREAVSRTEPTDEDDLDQPCWLNAVTRLEKSSPMLAAELRSAGELDGKMRDSIAVTMKSAVAPWLRSTVVGRGAEIPFTPALLEHPAATLFVVAPATGVAAGAAVACIDAISKRWRANQTEAVRLPRLLMVVDELANTMPWPKLPSVVTESRAMGIHLLVAVQATSQLAKRYGKEGMEELREVFPATLLLVGAPEKAMLEQAAWWAGQAERQKVSVDSIGRQTQTSEKADVITASDLLPRSVDEGRLLRGRRPGDRSPAVNEGGLLVVLKDISQMRFRSSKR